MPIDAGSERQAANCGSQGNASHCICSSPGGNSVRDAAFSARVANKITRDCPNGTDFSDDDITIRYTSAGGCSARHDGEVVTIAEVDAGTLCFSS